MKRILSIVLAVLLLVPLTVIVIDIVREPGSGQASVPVADAGQQIRHGAYLARAGNCMACHTAQGQPEYAGGRAIATPFGSIYSSNITPDIETGIGTWTADDFWRAIHNGKSKDGSFLYPAFPYTNYTKVSRADADALHAYFKTLPPIRRENRDNELRFPYNQRILLPLWRVLYFSAEPFRPEARRSAEWNRGAYLVQGLGHCSACHTPRDAFGGTSGNADLAGGMIPMLNWYASSLMSHEETGLGDWETRDIMDLLKTGVSQRGAVFGPMAEVVRGSLQHLSGDDVLAMASYLKSLPAPDKPSEPANVRAVGDATAVLKQGALLYEQHCVACHKADGKGVPPAYPPLAGNRSLTGVHTVNPIRMVLNGGYPPGTAGNPRPYGMPPFATTLNDDEIAAVVSYIRTSWDNKGGLVSPVEVRRFRGAAIE